MKQANDLFNKFYSGRMSPNELQRLREEVNQMSDDEIDGYLSDSMPDNMESDYRITSENSETLLRRLTAEINFKNRRHRIYMCIAAVAAVMLPIFITLTIVLGIRVAQLDGYQKVIADEHIIRSGNGEELLTVLPDGSRVRMAPESEICYSLSSFNDKIRNVDWKGEGEFEVVHNRQSPFVVHTGYFDIKVLGTIFSVDVRRDNGDATVYLKEGSVELSTSQSDYSCRLSPGYLATISRVTGEISVKRIDDFNSDIGSSTLTFYDIELAGVLSRLELYYPEHFDAPTEMASQRFTGALPKNNLNEALTILAKAYGLEVEESAERVKLVRSE
ncbi:FecR family protein [Muribaculum sp.]|uniref:FecR family protein n=1 Tax=Muribaculum sp. TaxID=1918611 RepID=UPI0023C4EEB6|nr:FecR domain-containing protein [Muribaculum sp.]MDE5704786.1 FecR domain-containing protein [Muribaculum sp.]